MSSTINWALRLLKKQAYENLRRRADSLGPKRGRVEVCNEGIDHIRAIVYIGDSAVGAHHIYRQWRAHFLEAGVPYAVLFRSAVSFDSCRREFPRDLLLYAKSAGGVDRVVASSPNLRTVYHTGNPRNVFDVLNHQRLRHISIYHGDGEKVANINPMFRVYDELWVAGQAQIDRLSHRSHNLSYRIIGRPQIRRLYNERDESCTASSRVAYLPTWEGASAGSDYSSCLLATELVRVSQRLGANVTVKLHPNTGHRLRSYVKLENKIEPLLQDDDRLLPRTDSSIEVMAAAQVCLTDVSSIVSDWLATNRPVFVYSEHEVESRARIPLSEYAYVFSNVSDFEALFERVVVDGDDFKKEARRAASEYLISPEATINNAFVENVREQADYYA